MKKVIEKPKIKPDYHSPNVIPTENPRIVAIRVQAKNIANKIKAQGGLK